MRHEINLPEIGDGITEAFVAEWLVPTGATVAAGDEILEVVTDKANVVIEADAAGTLVEHCVVEEDRVQVGQLLAVLEAADGAA
jgi:2-oxoglutarate dehydrogenase E2 component (dihydrolipoamide succinyltransferase)